LVHVDDLADLYVNALAARVGSVYVGVGGVNPTAKAVALAISRGQASTARSCRSRATAREQMGAVADAFGWISN
jgi:nucleoside-diphosphate-sugar epimerase